MTDDQVVVAVGCSWCGATPGHECVVRWGPWRTVLPHARRVRAAELVTLSESQQVGTPPAG